ncbi:aliphatic sulfonate ABC transporter substrate-binding protein [Oceanobacillus massiliensis]|uniref:aliphatic sulfonate ABC transporter substrate-binding protein n=1 Tax=Oceanobacillus massiliensis TaxID=1465765 RepID=UPI0002897926|nr:aliphatic sulfonate ABC transporter substrate-binding protein [Oceanobacillus massiliensis]
MLKKISMFTMFFACVILAGCSLNNSSANSEDEGVIRIGYQKNGPLIILKSLGTLEERLDSLGYTVEWNEFQAGPALVEALNAGSIDFGRTGNSPTIFAQAADTPFVTVAAGRSKYEGSGILVPEDSEIKTAKDLKGKKISFAKGSSSHYLLVKALENAGLSYTDIELVYLSPGDARIAFEQGQTDAMVVWDPYTASTEINMNATLLMNGEGLTTDRDFFIANEKFAEEHADLIKILEEEIVKSSDWANTNHDALVEMLAPILNIDDASIELAVERRIYGVEKINEEIIQEQQEIADAFFRLDIIPKEINVRDVMDKQ